jgi:hypothetical protein
VSAYVYSREWQVERASARPRQSDGFKDLRGGREGARGGVQSVEASLRLPLDRIQVLNVVGGPEVEVGRRESESERSGREGKRRRERESGGKTNGKVCLYRSRSYTMDRGADYNITCAILVCAASMTGPTSERIDLKQLELLLPGTFSYKLSWLLLYVSIRQHTSAYVSIRQHTSAYVSMLL